MPAKKTKTVQKTEVKIEQPIPETPQPAPAVTAPVPAPTPAAVVPETPVAAAPAEQASQVKPELVKAAAAVTVEPAKEEAPNLDGWVAVKELVPQGQGAKSTVKGGLFLLLGLIIGVAAGAGGMWWWSNKGTAAVTGKTNSLVKDIKKATGIAGTPGAASPSAAPAVGISKKDILLLVQNGSGVKGAAGVAADMLSDLGYQIAGTGNAAGGPFAESQLQIKQGKTEIAKLLETDLAEKYTLSKTLGTVADTATYDAVLIVGKK